MTYNYNGDVTEEEVRQRWREKIQKLKTKQEKGEDSND